MNLTRLLYVPAPGDPFLMFADGVPIQVIGGPWTDSVGWAFADPSTAHSAHVLIDEPNGWRSVQIKLEHLAIRLVQDGRIILEGGARLMHRRTANGATTHIAWGSPEGILHLAGACVARFGGHIIKGPAS